MEKITEGVNVPIYTWLPEAEIEPGAREQMINTANHPEAFSHVAIMPDAHQGFGVTIGTAFATENAVVPNAVGVDIGCGVSAINTGLPLDLGMDAAFWREWAVHVNDNIPTGFRSHSKPREMDSSLDHVLRAEALRPLQESKAPHQYGTLGGGNHFLEATVDQDGDIWLLVHSGSRAIGNAIAKHYHKLAIAQSEARGLGVGKDLASLTFASDEAFDYIHDLYWAQQYAYLNRMQMIRLLRNLLEYRCRVYGLPTPKFDAILDVPHNYAVYDPENEDVILHRKGATLAAPGTQGIVPGSMGSPSYIVRGKASAEAWQSCSHGAGRTMSRRKARENITEDQLRDSLAGTYTVPTMRTVDEAPGAYKDIKIVMERQADLVDITHTLRPIITIKGDSRAADD